jgi:hypothetical protein
VEVAVPACAHPGGLLRRRGTADLHRVPGVIQEGQPQDEVGTVGGMLVDDPRAQARRE